jgi:hypothetical protein
MVDLANEIDKYYSKTNKLLVPELKKYLRLIRFLHISPMQGSWEENCTVNLNEILLFTDQKLLEELIGRVFYCSDRMCAWRAAHIRKLYKEVCKRNLQR